MTSNHGNRLTLSKVAVMTPPEKPSVPVPQMKKFPEAGETPAERGCALFVVVNEIDIPAASVMQEMGFSVRLSVTLYVPLVRNSVP
jgi:hypothetical protein